MTCLVEPLPTPGLAILHPVPTSCRMQAVKPPGSLLGAFSFTSLSHDAPGYSSKLPPKRPWQSSARKKVRGGTFVWPEQRAGRCWQSSATIRHRPPRALQAPTSSYPGGLERVLPRRGLELSGRPRATPNRQRGLEVRRAHRPAGLEPSHRPHPSSSQLKATGVSRLQSRGSVKSIVL